MISLMYHDVVAAGKEDSSGFLGKDAGAYKLSKEHFKLHLDHISQAGSVQVRTLFNALSKELEGSGAVTLTFDDGGQSAYTVIAELLEEKGWHGHFFITTGFIGSNGFMTKDQIRSLSARGHIIGAHSCTHPGRFSQCPWDQQVHEWKVSTQTLSDIIGNQVTTGSVPGGYYSVQLAKAASLGGIRYLYTSEPTKQITTVDNCLILGRYSIKKTTSPQFAAALATDRLMPKVQQAVHWQLKKLTKKLAGNLYLQVRKKIYESKMTRF